MGIMRWITLILWLVIGLRNMSTGGGAVNAWQYGCAWFLLILHVIGDLLNYYEQHGDKEVMPLDKRVLEDYIDACAQVKETKADLLKLQKAKKRREQDAVKGSAHEFPYTAQTFHIEGIAYPLVQDPGEEDRLEEILRERLRNAERIKRDVEAWLNTISMRMQRIIRYRIFEELPWNDVAMRMGRQATAESVKKEYQRFMDAA